MNELKHCPFCGNASALLTTRERVGYGEYETTETSHTVECQHCGARSRSFHQKTLNNFTTHTVRAFRENPILRVKVEEEYDTYVKQLKDKAVEAWNQRVQ